MWSRLASVGVVLAVAGCMAGQRVSYDAEPFADREFRITFTGIDMNDAENAASLDRYASGTCDGRYFFRDYSEEEIIGLDEAKDTPRKTITAILSCEKRPA